VDVADAVHRADELRLERRDEEALQLLLATAKEHEDEDLWFVIADFYFARGMSLQGVPGADEQVLAAFDEADKWADLAGTRAGRAAVFARRKEWEKAEALLAEALELDPEMCWAHGVQGEMRILQGRPGEAVELLAKAVELSRGYGRAWALLVRALTAAGKKEFARKALAEAARNCPGDPDVLVTLAESYVEESDLARARRALEEAVEARRENPEAWRRLAWIAAKSGDDPGMVRALEKAVEVDRDGTLAWIEKERVTVPELNAFGQQQ
jgi:predicted Zn-dependent protease